MNLLGQVKLSAYRALFPLLRVILVSNIHSLKIKLIFHQAFTQLVKDELAKFPEEVQDDVVILFSAHSLPMSVSCFLS